MYFLQIGYRNVEIQIIFPTQANVIINISSTLKQNNLLTTFLLQKRSVVERPYSLRKVPAVSNNSNVCCNNSVSNNDRSTKSKR